MAEKNNHRGSWLVLAAATLWGTTGTTQALAPAGATPPVIGTLRLLTGGVVLLLIALFQGKLKGPIRLPFKSTLLAAIFIAAYQVLFFGGVSLTGVAVGTIVGIGSCPIMGGLLGAIFRKERPGLSWVIATFMAIVGATLLALGDNDVRVNIWGLLMALGAGATYAAFTLFSKDLLDNQPSETVLAVVFCLGALFLTPYLFTADLNWILQPQGLLVAAHLGIITVGVAYSLFGKGLITTPVSTTTTLTLAEPLTAGMLGIFFLGEKISWMAICGIILIFGGIMVLTFTKKR